MENNLLILICVLLAVILIWMIVITLLYISIIRSFRKVLELEDAATRTIFEGQDLTSELIRELVRDIELIDTEISKFADVFNEKIELATRDKITAMDTIKATRQIHAAIVERLGYDPTAKQEETEPKPEPEPEPEEVKPNE